MLREKQKIIHILDELLSYALRVHPQLVTIKIEQREDQVHITLTEPSLNLSTRECQEIERLLNTPSRNEMREYYGGLAGEETLDPRSLRILGMIVDGGHIESREGEISLSVWWKAE